MKVAFSPSDALIVVDVQNDFMPGWKLPVPEGDVVVPVINAWMAAAVKGQARVVVSRDWHPADHSSFVENGGPWPAHCVQNTEGAAFHPDLDLPGELLLISKGNRTGMDQYSDFAFTILADDLRMLGVKRVFVCGLAQDVCVKATVLDALSHGFVTHVLADATRPITHEGGLTALEEMRRAGAVVTQGQP